MDDQFTSAPMPGGQALVRMTAEQSGQMAQLVQQRRQLLAEILKTTLQQEAAIKEGLVEQLVARLNEKQQWIDQLKELQQAIAPFADCPAENRQWHSQDERQACRHALDDSARLQQAILEIDARCETVMSQQRNELFEQISATNEASEAAKAYSNAAPSPAARPRTRGASKLLAHEIGARAVEELDGRHDLRQLLLGPSQDIHHGLEARARQERHVHGRRPTRGDKRHRRDDAQRPFRAQQ